MAFLDSHSKVEPIAGYGFLKIGRVSENFRLGAGYTVFLTARHDIMSYVPFPGVLPLVSAGYKDTMPVSYTHLDVYKRQCRLRARCGSSRQARHNARKLSPRPKPVSQTVKASRPRQRSGRPLPRRKTCSAWPSAPDGEW